MRDQHSGHLGLSQPVQNYLRSTKQHELKPTSLVWLVVGRVERISKSKGQRRLRLCPFCFDLTSVLGCLHWFHCRRSFGRRRR